jgi:hypothetical protein
MAVIPSSEIEALARPDLADAAAARPGAFAARRNTTIYAVVNGTISGTRQLDLSELFRELATDNTRVVMVVAEEKDYGAERVISASVTDNAYYPHAASQYDDKQRASGVSFAATEFDHFSLFRFSTNGYIHPIEGAGASALSEAFDALVRDLATGPAPGCKDRFEPETSSIALSPSDVGHLASQQEGALFHWAPKGGGVALSTYTTSRAFVRLDEIASPPNALDQIDQALDAIFTCGRFTMPGSFDVFITDGHSVLVCSFSGMLDYDGGEVLIAEQDIFNGEQFGRYDAPGHTFRHIARAAVRSLLWLKHARGVLPM